MAAMTKNGDMSDTTTASVTSLDNAPIASASAMSVKEETTENLTGMLQETDVEMVSDIPPKKKSRKKKSLSSQEMEMKTEGDDPTSESPVKRKKRSSGGGEETKNALQTLNELMPGLQYNCISQTGPVHQPTFTVQVQVNDQVRHCFLVRHVTGDADVLADD